MDNSDEIQLINKTAKKNSKNDFGSQDSNEDNNDIVSFSDYVEPPKNCISVFSFNNEEDSYADSTNKTIPDNRINTGLKSQTPPVDNEPLNIRRGYSLRRSTVLMLQELKFLHPDINVYMNTIVDTAIRHYYDYIKNQGGSQV